MDVKLEEGPGQRGVVDKTIRKGELLKEKHCPFVTENTNFLTRIAP